MKILTWTALSWLAVAASAAAKPHDVLLPPANPVSDAMLAELTAGTAAPAPSGATWLSFPGPDVTLDFVRIEPQPQGLTAALRFSGMKESCGPGNCDQAIVSVSVGIVVSGLTGFSFTPITGRAP